MPRTIAIAALTLFVGLTILLLLPGAAASQQSEPLEGWLSIVWGDVRPGDEPWSPRRVVLTTDAGQSITLVMSEPLLRGGVFRWNGRRVTVYPVVQDEAWATEDVLRVAAIQLAG